jgi:phosphoadenosine phosphosulfate reductase
MSDALKRSAVSLNAVMSDLSTEETLLMLTCYFTQGVTFSTSFSKEDQIIAHLIATYDFDISIFTLDTGRHFPETYAVWVATLQQFKIPVKAYFPQTGPLEDFITSKGPDAFYRSLASRKECCYLRKVEPLKRALAGNLVWVTGLRAGQSFDRNALSQFEWDDSSRIIKYNPLLHWTDDQVDRYIAENGIPISELYRQGFSSIGCQPCTRAVKPGEALRAGRWWWETSGQKECGLHMRPEFSY